VTSANRPDVSAEVEAAAEARRLQPIDSAHMVARPATISSSYAEREYDELAAEQEPLWRAEGAVAARSADTQQCESQLAFKTARRQLKLQRAVVLNAQHAYLNALEQLRPYRRREPGAKKWYLARWVLLLGGDIAGQAGAALSYGEHPLTAIPQALASGMAALTAGMVGGELRDLRSAARRHRDADGLPVELQPWAHLFRVPDRGRALALLAIGLGATAGLAIAGGIFSLRMVIEGSAAGAVYGLLAVGITLASAVNAYFYADEVADQIDSAQADYTRELTRAAALAGHPELRRHAASRAEAASIRDEHHARGEAARRHLSALKWRVLGNNPGVAGHGFGPEAQPPIGRRNRGGEPS